MPERRFIQCWLVEQPSGILTPISRETISGSLLLTMVLIGSLLLLSYCVERRRRRALEKVTGVATFDFVPPSGDASKNELHRLIESKLKKEGLGIESDPSVPVLLRCYIDGKPIILIFEEPDDPNEPWILRIDYPLVGRFRPRHQERFLSILDQVLSSELIIRNVSWYSPANYSASGEDS